jgi:SMI1 / KNR4 family (SUKH-1)
VNDEILEQFKQYVLERGGKLYPPITPERIAELERRFGVVLPDDLRRIYLEFGGTEYDDDMNRFVPIEEFDEIHLDKDLLIFFERSLLARTWGIQRNPRVGTESWVFEERKVADSINEFLEKLMAGSL